MTYQEILAHIYGLGRFGIKPGLDRIASLLSAIGNPQERTRSVHVAGTNGKGSTAALLASIVSGAGYKVGLFTSPHLSRFTERIRINGIEITEEDVVSLAGKVMLAAPPAATFFEIVTAMAWLHFSQRDVDLAVMETGMGGRFDATNAGSGIISVITPISMDHCEYLGGTLAEIAFEKAGVIKQGSPVVVSDQEEEALAVIERRCAELASPLFRYGKDFSGCWENSGVAYHGLNRELSGLRPGIAGRYQTGNAACALAAAELLGGMGFALNDTMLRGGIERTAWPGRMEMVEGERRILLDGAHNPAGGRALAAALQDVQFDRLFLVAGVMSDKDAEGIFAPLVPLIDKMFAVSPSLERAVPSDSLAALCRGWGIACEDAGTVGAGIASARERAGSGDLILVCGSLFTVGEARAVIFKERFEPFRG